MTDDEFEWDDAKAAVNLAKHNVSFEIARLVFDDAFAIVEVDGSLDYSEERFIITGMIQNRLLSVVYTERMGRIRLISARKSTKREQNDYYRHQAPE
jgi:uncharacterized DUF497 family protein